MNLVLTKHAQDMAIERGISRKMIEIVIRRGSKFRQTGGLLSVYGYVRIAYRVEGDTFIVKTVMVEGGK